MTEIRVHQPTMSTWWWTKKRSYFVFVMRELSSIFVAWWVVFLLLLVNAVGRGEKAPAAVIIASQYVGLAVVSAFVLWLVTR